MGSTVVKCSCGKRCRVPENHRSKSFRCPDCGSKLVVSSTQEHVLEDEPAAGSLPPAPSYAPRKRTTASERPKQEPGKNSTQEERPSANLAHILRPALIVLLLGGGLYSTFETMLRVRDLWSIDLRQNDHRVRRSRIQVYDQTVRVENQEIDNADFVKACHQKTIAVFRFFDNRMAVIATDDSDSFPESEFQRFVPALEYLSKNPMGEQVVYSTGLRLSRGAKFYKEREPLFRSGPPDPDLDEYRRFTSLGGHVMTTDEHHAFHDREVLNNLHAYYARKKMWSFPFSAVTTADIGWFAALMGSFVLLIVWHVMR